MKISPFSDFKFRFRINDISGFSLVEVTIAIGLVAFCLVAMLGMVPVGLRQERKSLNQQGAVQVMTALAADVKASAAGTNATTTRRYKIPLQAGSNSFYIDHNFDRKESLDSTAAYRVFYRVMEPSSNVGSYKIHFVVAPPTTTPNNRDFTDYMETIVFREAQN